MDRIRFDRSTPTHGVSIDHSFLHRAQFCISAFACCPAAHFTVAKVVLAHNIPLLLRIPAPFHSDTPFISRKNKREIVWWLLQCVPANGYTGSHVNVDLGTPENCQNMNGDDSIFACVTVTITSATVANESEEETSVLMHPSESPKDVNDLCGAIVSVKADHNDFTEITSSPSDHNDMPINILVISTHEMKLKFQAPLRVILGFGNDAIVKFRMYPAIEKPLED